MPSLFVNQISVIDCALLLPDHGLTGASWIVDAVLDGELDSQGMLFDFGPAKSLIKQLIDELVDHKLIVAEGDPNLRLNNQNEVATLEYNSNNGDSLRLRSPIQAIRSLKKSRIDADTVATALAADILPALPDNVTGLTFTLREEIIDGAAYGYCHGLKKHQGNCQRIAHGHRSRIHILVNGERSNRREQQWAQRWQNVYLGNRADLANADDEQRFVFRYEADQGQFELELAAARCALIDADTTVENIAAHIAGELKQHEPEHHFEVRAFEGVNKGAIACA